MFLKLFLDYHDGRFLCRYENIIGKLGMNVTSLAYVSPVSPSFSKKATRSADVFICRNFVRWISSPQPNANK